MFLLVYVDGVIALLRLIVCFLLFIIPGLSKFIINTQAALQLNRSIQYNGE